MAIVKIEGKEVTLPDDVVNAGHQAIRAVLSANGFPAVENADIQIEGGKFELTGEKIHPKTGEQIRTFQAWSYDRVTQTASVRTRREFYAKDSASDAAPSRIAEHGPTDLHCVFYVEMAHLLARAGFEVEAVYGDFARHALNADSTEMIWVGRSP